MICQHSITQMKGKLHLEVLLVAEHAVLDHVDRGGEARVVALPLRALALAPDLCRAHDSSHVALAAGLGII